MGSSSPRAIDVPPVIVQSAVAGNGGEGIGNLTLPGLATAGNLLLMVTGHRDNWWQQEPDLPGGWLRDGYNHLDTNGPPWVHASGLGIWARIAAGGEQVVVLPRSNNDQWVASGWIAEIAGLGAVLAGIDRAGADVNHGFATYPALAPTHPGAPAFLVRADWKQPTSPNPGPMGLSGWALGGDSGYENNGNRLRLTVFVLPVAALAVNYPAETRSDSFDYGDEGVCITAALYGIPSAGIPRGYW